MEAPFLTRSLGFRRVQVKDLAEQSFGAGANSGRGAHQTRTVLVVCSTFRDHRELPRLRRPGLDYLFHDYASTSLEELIGGRAEGWDGAADPITEVARICAEIRDRAIAAVVSTDDYPGSALAAVLAKELGLPGPDQKVNLICQHKYWSRVAQARFAPEAVPPFWPIDVADNADLPGGIALPVFVKPVKSFFSIGAQRIDSAAELTELKHRWGELDDFFLPLERLLEREARIEVGGGGSSPRACLKATRSRSRVMSSVVRSTPSVWSIPSSFLAPSRFHGLNTRLHCRTASKSAWPISRDASCAALASTMGCSTSR